MRPLRVLLLAYEYPPIVAAQSLRWFYLANELAGLGVEIHVLCPSMPALPDFPVPNHALIVEHRVWAGPFIGFSQWLAMRGNQHEDGTEPGDMPGKGQSLLFRAYRAIRFVLDRALYPDVRTEWYPFARYRLARLLRQYRFDAVISSHEPGVDLLLGLWAKKHHDVRWIVDLADPLCAPYSPKWRRWLDLWVEGKVIRLADRVVLTTDHLRDLLVERHGLTDGGKFACIPQGAPTGGTSQAVAMLVPGKMNIVFTGNFYEAFRNPQHFAAALKSLSSQEIAVTIVGDNARFRPMFEGVANVRFLGKTGHFECLALQCGADLLLNIGNAQAFQIPGKIYEYLGAGRQILHIRSAPGDPSEDLLLDTGLGRVVDNDVSAIATALNDLLGDWRNGELGVASVSVAKCVAEHSWSSRARLLYDLISETKVPASTGQKLE